MFDLNHVVTKSPHNLLQCRLFFILFALSACPVKSYKAKPDTNISTDDDHEIKENEHNSKKIKEVKEVEKNGVAYIGNMRSNKFRDNVRKQLIEALTSIGKARSGEHLSTGIFSPCSRFPGLESNTTCIR